MYVHCKYVKENLPMNIGKVRTHFKSVDPIIYPIIKTINFSDKIQPRQPSQYFTSLCSEIISQQLSGKAADAIEKKFINIFPKKHITPEAILKFSDQELRDVGMSWAKVKYIKNLSEKVLSGTLNLRTIQYASDQEVINILTQVKGIGQWTAEMFLIFTLGRENVFSHGDLGLRKAIKNLYKVEAPNEIIAIVDKWSPYKTYGSLALWHSLDNRP